jgi:type IV secretion system protein VirB9
MRLAASMAFLVAALALTQAAAALSADDPRIQVATYSSGKIIDLRTSAAVEQTVLLAPDERIQTVVLGDPSTYSVTISPNGDSFSLRQLYQSIGSTLTVQTDKRSYQFMASPAYGPVPYLVRLTLPERDTNLQAVQVPSAQLSESRIAYKITGDRDVRPASIRDDGARTYIQWGPSQAIPAVFAGDRKGHEEIVNGYMRGGEFTVDRVYDKLIFRIDEASAKVRRVRVKVK